jgi:hypothetical protein
MPEMKQPGLHDPELQYCPDVAPLQVVPSVRVDQDVAELVVSQYWHVLPDGDAPLA